MNWLENSTEHAILIYGAGQLFGLILYITVNNFSVMSGQVEQAKGITNCCMDLVLFDH